MKNCQKCVGTDENYNGNLFSLDVESLFTKVLDDNIASITREGKFASALINEETEMIFIDEQVCTVLKSIILDLMVAEEGTTPYLVIGA